MLSVIPHIQIEAFDGVLNDWTQVPAARQPIASGGHRALVQAQAILVRGDAVRGALISGSIRRRNRGCRKSRITFRAHRSTPWRPANSESCWTDLAHALSATWRQGDRGGAEGNLTPAHGSALEAVSGGGTFSSAIMNSTARCPGQSVGRRAAVSPAGPTAVRLRLRDMQQAPSVAQRLALELGPQVLCATGQREPHLVRRHPDRKADDVPDPGADRRRGSLQSGSTW